MLKTIVVALVAIVTTTAADAAFIITGYETGDGVVWEGTGALNLDGMEHYTTANSRRMIANIRIRMPKDLCQPNSSSLSGELAKSLA